MKRFCTGLTLLATLVLLVVNCTAESGSPAPTAISSREEQLIEAERANQTAQAAYYTKLIEPTPPKGFWANIRENPASVLGVLAAFVAFISFIFNYRATLLAQENTQFYEALQRFGDKDSAALRASSAAILAQMATIRRRSYFPKRLFTRQHEGHLAFFETVCNQLTVGYLIEENRVGILSIRDALTRLLEIDSLRTTERLYRISERLIVELLSDLTDYFIAHGTKRSEEVTDGQWNRASAIGIGPTTLKQIVARRAGDFDAAFTYKPLSFEVLTVEKRAEALALAKDKLSLTTFRLRSLVVLFNHAFGYPTAGLKGLSSPSLFLVRASLAGRDLRGFDLSMAYMGSADLTKANLTGAWLHNTWLGGATVDGAKMWHAQINDKTDLSDCDWWKADFFDEKQQAIDEQLVRHLNETYGLPDNPEEAHPSVLRVFPVEDIGTTNPTTNNTSPPL
jgi:hypothetical protein